MTVKERENLIKMLEEIGDPPQWVIEAIWDFNN